MMNIIKVHFAVSVRNTETSLRELKVHGSRNLSQIGGRQLRAHYKSAVHIQSCEASLLVERATQQGTIIQQLQHVADEDNRKACTHF